MLSLATAGSASKIQAIPPATDANALKATKEAAAKSVSMIPEKKKEWGISIGAAQGKEGFCPLWTTECTYVCI